MRCIFRTLCCLAILCLPLCGVAVAEDDVTMEGTFVWARDDGDIEGDLTAIMTPAGEGEWSVAFHFVWEEEPHIYTGKVKGNLSNGKLEGTAINDNDERRMNFKFSGDVEDGTFHGTHGFVQDDGEVRDGGTLTLSRKKS